MGYMDRLVKEAIEIQLHPNNFNRDNGFMLSQAQDPSLTCSIRRRKLSNIQTGWNQRGARLG
jgi:hypothetical protein